MTAVVVLARHRNQSRPEEDYVVAGSRSSVLAIGRCGGGGSAIGQGDGVGVWCVVDSIEHLPHRVGSFRRDKLRVVHDARYAVETLAAWATSMMGAARELGIIST
jgi:hypothetical protein